MHFRSKRYRHRRSWLKWCGCPTSCVSNPRAKQHLTEGSCTPELRSLKALLTRQSPGQLGPQSQSFSRSYGSSLPTSLTYMCLTLQRLRTLETGCGYRVRSVPNLSGVCVSKLLQQSCFKPSTTFSRTGRNTETHTTVVALCRNGSSFRQPNCFQE